MLFIGFSLWIAVACFDFTNRALDSDTFFTMIKSLKSGMLPMIFYLSKLFLSFCYFSRLLMSKVNLMLSFQFGSRVELFWEYAAIFPV